MRFQSATLVRLIMGFVLVATLSVRPWIPAWAQPAPAGAAQPSLLLSPRAPLTLEGATSLGSDPGLAYGRFAHRLSLGFGRLELGALMGAHAQNGAEYGRAEGRLLFDAAKSTMWLGVAGQRDYDRGESTLPLLGIGGWKRLGNFVSSAAVQQTRDGVTHYDYHYSYADTGWVATGRSESIRRATIHTGLGWSRGRVALESAAGISLSHAAGPRTWVRGSAAMTVLPGFAIVGTGGSAAPALFGTPESEHGQATLGVRLTPAWSPARVGGHGGGSDSPSWQILHETAGWYRIEVRAENARSVEITSDATEWAPRSLEQVAKNRWRLRLELAPGLYHMNLRVDGGPWIVPPGAPTASDEFVGATGVFVVPN